MLFILTETITSYHEMLELSMLIKMPLHEYMLSIDD